MNKTHTPPNVLIADFGGLTNGTYVLLTYGGNLTTNSLIRIKPLSGDLTATLDYGSGSNSSITLVTTLGADLYVEYGYCYFGTPDGIGAKTADADGDGMTNEQEMLAGTDPTDSASVMRMTSLTSPGSDMVITWRTSGGDPLFTSAPKTNIIEYADDLSAGFTNALAIIVITTYGDQVTNVTDSAAASLPHRFYRVRLGP